MAQFQLNLGEFGVTTQRADELVVEFHKGEYTISTDKARLELTVIHDFLSHSYWAEGIPLATVQKSIQNSLCFGIYHQERQVGFARAISDYTTYAYLADVFVLENHRGHGLGKWLIQSILSHPELQGLRRWALATRDAQGLYAQFGFKIVENPENEMLLRIPNPYKKVA
jgi:GNAT superfamily N-acetyltransferase